jgi:hypothetical protein
MAPSAKRLLIFADGTGNAFATQESNVWRLYQAIDKSDGEQIAYYIPGVGTSDFRPWAVIDGATGLGVPANVRGLYEFLCWNWHKDAEICLFGFSRGAFTIRTLIGLIDREGLVPREIDGRSVTKSEMDRQVRAAWRSYRSKSAPVAIWRRSPFLGLTRMIRDGLLAARDWLLGWRPYRKVRQKMPKERTSVPIKFVGLFDTVEAFGVPFEEFRRAIDWAIWPISFDNRKLSATVQRACHALSLDDERTTFHPILFDAADGDRERISQVWFAGAHSDVGGGYPDADLEHVPLGWMADHAAAEGVKFAAGALESFRYEASATGPRHDSRSGLGVFYRYSPRHVPDTIGGEPPVIHHSVVERMVFGCDGYAPIVLPAKISILMPDGKTRGEVSGFKNLHLEKLRQDPKMRRAERALDSLREPDEAPISLLRDTVWWRKVSYFALLTTALLTASLPWTADALTRSFFAWGTATAVATGSSSWWAQTWEWLSQTAGALTALLTGILAMIGGLIPGYAKPWVDSLTSEPITFLTVIASLALLYWANGHLRDRVSDLARRAWFEHHDAGGLARRKGTRSTPTFAGMMRSSVVAKGMRFALADVLLPALGVLAIYLTLFVAAERTLVSVYEGGGEICAPTKPEPARLTPGILTYLPRWFDTRDPCWATGMLVEKGRKYTVWLDMREPYFDASLVSDIAGFTDNESWRHRISIPFRRWLSAAWFEPIARIGSRGAYHFKMVSVNGDGPLPLGIDRDGNNFPPHFFEDHRFKERLLDLRSKGELPFGRADYRIPDEDIATASAIWRSHRLQTLFAADFVASADGELYLYVNDVLAALPFWGPIRVFYQNNRGTAEVILLEHALPIPGNLAR